MIDLRLTNREAIALHSFLSNRHLMASKDPGFPQSVKDDLAASAVDQPELSSAEEKLAAELDNMLQAQRMTMEGDRNAG